MIDNVAQYLMHVAPSIVVIGAVLFVVLKRMDTMERYLAEMLKDCWSKLFDHLTNEDK